MSKMQKRVDSNMKCPECSQEMNPEKYGDEVYYCANVECDIVFIEVTRKQMKGEI